MSSPPNRSQLFLIRHAQSQNNAADETERVCDPSITSLGHQQAQAMAKFLAATGIDSVISSAFRRALQTAEYLRRAVGLQSEIVIDLHEHGGCYTGWHEGNISGMPGLTATEIVEEFGDVAFPNKYPVDGWWQSKPRESHDQSALRAGRIANYLQGRLAETRTNLACVTHADFLAKLLVAMFGQKIEQEESFRDLKNVGITRIILDGEKMQFMEVNSVDFLPAELVSS